MWGRPLKAHPHRGGYPTLQDFCAVYGLNLKFCLLDAFLHWQDEEKKTIGIPRYTHIFAFCRHWCIRQSVCALSCIMYARMCVLG